MQQKCNLLNAAKTILACGLKAAMTAVSVGIAYALRTCCAPARKLAPLFFSAFVLWLLLPVMPAMAGQALIIDAQPQPFASLLSPNVGSATVNSHFATPGWYDRRQSLTNADNAHSIARALGWVPAPNSNDLCHGYYRQPAEVVEFSAQPLNSNAPIKVSSSGPTSLLQDGRTILRQNVVATQTGRITKGDRAILYRNKDTGVLEKIEVFGHVRYIESNRLLLGDYARIDVKNNHFWIKHALYHLYSISADGSVRNGWGSAERIDRLANAELLLKHANYTTCSPQHNVWRIHAKTLRINKKKGWAVAHQVVLTAKHIPVFYSPYLSFPIDSRRKTGFLFPIFSANFSKGSAAVTVPFYWNMAPNYDMTISPHFMTDRGVQLNDLFRYLILGGKDSGSLHLSVLPYDPGFENEKNNLIKDYKATPAVADEINNYNQFRNYFDFKNDGYWGKNNIWSSSLQLQHSADPYYLQDFGGNSTGTSANQLLNKGQIKYNGDIWQGSILAMGYQTLHQLNQVSVQDQYRRLPELDLQGYYPQLIRHVDLSLGGSATKFVFPDTVYSPANVYHAAGSRLHSRPGVLFPFNLHGLSITPQFWDDNLVTAFDQGGVTTPAHPTYGQKQKTVARSIPMLALDNKLYLRQNFHLGNWGGVEAISPELFYLYVPYQNQDRFPLFDTQNQLFNYSRLYALNQFTGVDRMQNANQISIGLELDTLNASNGAPILTIANGLIWYFDPRKVTLNPLTIGEKLPLAQTQTYSPFVSQVTLNLSHWLSLTGNSTWDLQQDLLSNADAGVTSTFNANTELYAGYSFVSLGAEDMSGKVIDLQQAYLGARFSLTSHIKGLAYGKYNFAQDFPITSYAGLEYDSCCWAMRGIVSHDFLNYDKSHKPQLETQYYLQIELTGLGSIGNRTPTSLLSTLPGYTDGFQHHMGV